MRLTTSGLTSSRSQFTIFRAPPVAGGRVRPGGWKWSGRRGPRTSWLTAKRDDPADSRRRASRRRSSSQGVWRKNASFCCRYALMPPRKTRFCETSASSVRMGVGRNEQARRDRPRPAADTSVLSCRQLPQNIPPAPALMYAMPCVRRPHQSATATSFGLGSQKVRTAPRR